MPSRSVPRPSGEAPVERHALPAGRQRLLGVPGVPQPVRVGDQAHGEVRGVDAGALLRQQPVALDRLAGGGQRLPRPAVVTELRGEGVQAQGQRAPEGVGMPFDEAPAELYGLPCGRHRLAVPSGAVEVDGEVVEPVDQAGAVRVGVPGRQAAPDIHRLLDRPQGLGEVSRPPQERGVGPQDQGEAREVGVRALLGEPPVEGDGLPGGLQRLPERPSVVLAEGEVVQAVRQCRPVGVAVLGHQPPPDGDDLPDRLQRLGGPARLPSALERALRPWASSDRRVTDAGDSATSHR